MGRKKKIPRVVDEGEKYLLEIKEEESFGVMGSEYSGAWHGG
jgi:hypothetical protein